MDLFAAVLTILRNDSFRKDQPAITSDPEFTLRAGSQTFGSGGYNASWKIEGTFRVVSTKESSDSFASVVETKVKVTSPLAAVRQWEGDAFGEGRSWSWRAVYGPADEIAALIDLVCSEVAQATEEEINKVWIHRRPGLVDRVREAVDARRTFFVARRVAREARRELLRQQAALRAALRYAGDEATAKAAAHLFR